jgi:hypothetical protein
MDAAQIKPSTVNGNRPAVKPRSPVRDNELIGLLIAHDRGDAGDHQDSERGREPSESVGHRNNSARTGSE